MSTQTVYVSILDKEYQIACPEGEREALQNSAHLLDERMRTIRASGTVIGVERIAIMTALNLCNELLSDEQISRGGASDAELSDVNQRLASTLAQLENT